MGFTSTCSDPPLALSFFCGETLANSCMRFSVGSASGTDLDAVLLDSLHYLLHLSEELLLGTGGGHGPETDSHPKGSPP